jgi:hypothetical protein
MIAVDFHQVVISNLQMQMKGKANRGNPEAKSLIFHMILTTLLSYKKKFGKEYGQIVIATDSKKYWRKEVFPLYKGHRKRDREKSDVDWDFIFECMNEVKADLRENFPYKVIEVEGAEADDTIACLAKYSQDNELVQVGILDGEPQPMMIVSSDTDFMQLQKYPNVKQWSPMQKKMIKPTTTLKEFVVAHICQGDAGDGIPNICSPEDSLFEKIRQKSFKTARLPEFLNKGIEACANEDERRRYQLNERLIDFEFIPERIYNDIINEYESQKVQGSKTKVFNYLVKNRMRHLLENAGDF